MSVLTISHHYIIYTDSVKMKQHNYRCQKNSCKSTESEN